MGWNLTEIIGKLVGSGLFVLGFTSFFERLFNWTANASISGAGYIATVINGGSGSIGMTWVQSELNMQAIMMIIGLTLLFIKYPETK